MDFRLTPEQDLIRETVARFCADEVRPQAKAMDGSDDYPWPLGRRMGELGLMGMRGPEEWGGAGTDTVSFALAAEEITRASATMSVIFGANNSLTCGPIEK